MKRVMKLGNLIGHLPAAVKDGLLSTWKDAGAQGDIDNADICRRAFSEAVLKEKVEPGTRAVVRRVSARSVDSVGDVVVPSGGELKDFAKYGHFFWGHNYSLPPLGSDDWIKADDFGIVAKSRYADTGEGTLANVMWHLVQQGHQKASSIGFIPVASTMPGHNDWDRTCAKLAKDWPEFAKAQPDARRIITRWILLEHSDVGVPCQLDATEIMAVAKQAGADDKLLTQLGWTALATLGPTDGSEPDVYGEGSTPPDAKLVDEDAVRKWLKEHPEFKLQVEQKPAAPGPVRIVSQPFVRVLAHPMDIGALAAQTAKEVVDRISGRGL